MALVRKPISVSEAEQIAHLLNINNSLQTHYNGNRILDSPARYYPEGYEGLVFSSIALQRWNFLLTEVKHLVVHSGFRRIGLARAMLKRAVARAETPLLCATIREGNSSSLKLFISEGFNVVADPTVNIHKVFLLIKKNDAPREIDIGIREPQEQSGYNSGKSYGYSGAGFLKGSLFVTQFGKRMRKRYNKNEGVPSDKSPGNNGG